MAIQSKEFVGIAEGIKSHELSTKGRIESLKGEISELSNRRMSLGNQISYLEAVLAAAYEDTDEDGDPDYARIVAIEAQINEAKNDLSEVEYQLDTGNGELSELQAELDDVIEERARTLFEIQERARKTSNNITIAGGMYGAYAGVGASLQSSMQTSLASLSQAASILDGSVDAGASSGSSGGSGSGASGVGTFASNDVSTSALGAFSTGNSFSGSIGGSASSPSAFESSQIEVATPAFMSGFRSSSKTINAQKTLNFKSEQNGNESAILAFGVNGTENNAEETVNFNSDQTTSNLGENFSSTSNDAAETSNHYGIDQSNGNVTFKGQLKITKGNHKNMPSKTKAYLPGDERGHVNASSLDGPNTRENVVPQHQDVNHGAYYSVEKGERTALQNGATIESEKIAIVDGQPGDRPNTFVVNDVVTYADGHTESIHHSFTNESYAEQSEWNEIISDLHGTFTAPNHGDGLRDSMSAEQYASLMQQTDAELPELDAEYKPTTCARQLADNIE